MNDFLSEQVRSLWNAAISERSRAVREFPTQLAEVRTAVDWAKTLAPNWVDLLNWSSA